MKNYSVTEFCHPGYLLYREGVLVGITRENLLRVTTEGQSIHLTISEAKVLFEALNDILVEEHVSGSELAGKERGEQHGQ